MGRILVLTPVLLSGICLAQANGVPASVTSYGPGRGQAPGVPASVTSLGPNGYGQPCKSAECQYFNAVDVLGRPLVPPTKGKKLDYSGGYRGDFVYVPGVFPIVTEMEEEAPEPEPAAVQPARAEPVAADLPATPVPRALQPAAQPPAAEVRPVAATVSPEPGPRSAVVIVFKDGHQEEISNGNYAIIGDTLYDLSRRVTHEIKRGDVDLKNTERANRDRGVEFTWPQA